MDHNYFCYERLVAIAFALTAKIGRCRGDGVKSQFFAFEDAFAATNAFDGVDFERIAVGFRGDHIDGVESANGHAFLAISAFGLIDGVMIGGAFAGVDEDHGHQGEQEKNAGKSFHGSALKRLNAFQFCPRECGWFHKRRLYRSF